MPKGRIGLSLSEDVLAILNEYGRVDTSGLSLEAAKAVWRGMLNNSSSISERLQAEEVLAGLERPTRTEIIEQAVREWSARQHNGTSARPVKRTTVAEIDRIIADPPPNTVFMMDDDLAPNSLSPEAAAARTEKKEAKRARKAERIPLSLISDPEERLKRMREDPIRPSQPLERGNIQPIPKPGKK